MTTISSLSSASRRPTCFTSSGLTFAVETEPSDGRVIVRIRPVSAEPGRDHGPRTCLQFATDEARGLAGLLLACGDATPAGNIVASAAAALEAAGQHPELCGELRDLSTVLGGAA